VTIMTDVITEISGSVVHHGPANDRAYLMKLNGDPAQAAARLEKLAATRGYSKIIAKVPAAAKEVFAAAGFQSEAQIPRYYGGREAAHFLTKYLDPQRRRAEDPEKLRQVLAAARSKAGQPEDSTPEFGFSCRVAGPPDSAAMAEVYRRVFATYPFPIHDPAYLERTMRENIVYFGVWQGEKLVALSSAEMDLAAGSAEMTDFATLPEHRGQGLATGLLTVMEQEMEKRGLHTLFTIARAVSFGMNITFARRGFRYGGTLTRNTQISGCLECMNIWHKPLRTEH